MTAKVRVFCAFALVLLLAHCANSAQSDLEAAEAALNDEQYQEALNLADPVLSDEPSNLRAARIVASAHFGLSALPLNDITTQILTLQDSTEPNFAVIADAVPAGVALASLQSAIDTFENFPDTLGEDDAFQLGMYEAFASFVVGIVSSGYADTPDTLAFDDTAIPDADVENVRLALINFDNQFIASGVAEDDELITSTRETYCLVTENAAGLFTAPVYRALVCCQLLEDDCTNDLLVSTGSGIADCSAFDPGQQDVSFDTCKTSDTE